MSLRYVSQKPGPAPARFENLPVPSYLRASESTAVQVRSCLSIKGAEDAINKPHAFEVSTTECNLFFIADSDKVPSRRFWGVQGVCCRDIVHTGGWGCRQGRLLWLLQGASLASFPLKAQSIATSMLQEKEDWINAVGRSIVRHSRR